MSRCARLLRPSLDNAEYFMYFMSAVEHVRRGCGIGAVLAPCHWDVDGGELALDKGSGPPDDELLFRASDVVCREQRTSRCRSRRWSFWFRPRPRPAGRSGVEGPCARASAPAVADRPAACRPRTTRCRRTRADACRVPKPGLMPLSCGFRLCVRTHREGHPRRIGA